MSEQPEVLFYSVVESSTGSMHTLYVTEFTLFICARISRRDGERWAGGQDNIDIPTVNHVSPRLQFKMPKNAYPALTA